MAHHAHIDENNIVTEVLVITQDELDTGEWGDPSSWLKTSYNTRRGVHYEPNVYPPVASPDQSKALRGNFAGIGHSYVPDLDIFIEPSPFPSWIIDAETASWKAPKPEPEPVPGFYWDWDEQAQEWELVEDQGTVM